MKKRLDLAVVEKGLAKSRERAKALIMAGRILVNEMPADKPGQMILDNDRVGIRGEDIPYVSRGGLKLACAISTWDIPVCSQVCLDVGASTGGFTDCLLQEGAKKVYAVDVGYGQIAWKLRQDPRVEVIERTNFRYMNRSRIPEPVDLVVVDVSFISLKIIVPKALEFLQDNGIMVVLVKPQFEVGKGKVGKGGVVRDTALHQEVIHSLSLFFQNLGMETAPTIPSPITGPKGNQEYLMALFPGKSDL